jgi:hypothetical protein
MTLRVYADVTGMRSQTRMGALLTDADWAQWALAARKRTRAVPTEATSKSPDPARLQRKRETGATGLEPAASGVTGRRSNQLSYAPEAYARAFLDPRDSILGPSAYSPPAAGGAARSWSSPGASRAM